MRLQFEGEIDDDSKLYFDIGYVEFYTVYWGVPISESYEGKRLFISFSDIIPNDPELIHFKPILEVELFNAPKKKYCGKINSDGMWKFYDGFVQICPDRDERLIGSKCSIQLIE